MRVRSGAAEEPSLKIFKVKKAEKVEN
jgi:hypothetical protein